MARLKKFFSDYREACVVIVGEIIISLLMVGIYLLIGAFDMSVVYGALLGSAVTVANLFALSFLVNRAVAKYMRLRGEKEMSDEEAAAFAAEHGRSVQLAARGSYIVRTVMMVGALALAFILSDMFDVVATLIPLIAYRPIIFVSEIIRMKTMAKGLKRFNFDADSEGLSEGAGDIEVDDFEDLTDAPAGDTCSPPSTPDGEVCAAEGLPVSDESEVKDGG